MKGGVPKIWVDGYRQKDVTEFERYTGVQTFIWMTKNHLTEVSFTKDDLLERIVSPISMNLAYKRGNRTRGWRG